MTLLQKIAGYRNPDYCETTFLRRIFFDWTGWKFPRQQESNGFSQSYCSPEAHSTPSAGKLQTYFLSNQKEPVTKHTHTHKTWSHMSHNQLREQTSLVYS